MPPVILYGSCYGTTRQYAQALSERTGLPCLDHRRAGALDGCDGVVYLGGLYAGGVLGLAKTVRRLPARAAERLIVVTVGLADPAEEENVRNIRTALHRQLSPDCFGRAQFFHLRGGIDYARLNPVHRTMMRLLYLQVKRVPPEQWNAETRAMVETYQQKVSFVDPDTLAPVIQAVSRWKDHTGAG